MIIFETDMAAQINKPCLQCPCSLALMVGKRTMKFLYQLSVSLLVAKMLNLLFLQHLQLHELAG